MNVVKCVNGHIYDADKLGNCPYCPGVIRRLEYQPDTFGKNQGDLATEVSVKGEKEAFGMVARRHVGILVMKKGKRDGQIYNLYEGTNRIGRAENMEVSLPEEDTISRSGHAEILYQKGCFMLFATKKKPDLFLNHKRVNGHAELHDRDHIEAGECEFIFVRFDDVYE